MAWEGCNYCAGGISPPAGRRLAGRRSQPAPDIVEGSATAITVHGDWKSVELPIPEAEKCSRSFGDHGPGTAPAGYLELRFVLARPGIDKGATIIAAEARRCPLFAWRQATDGLPGRHGYGEPGGDDRSRLPRVRWQASTSRRACAYNPIGCSGDRDRTARVSPTRGPQGLICEMQAEEDLLQYMQGEVHFARSGSGGLHIEMSSLIPKGRWVTVVLLGKSVDRAEPSQYGQIMERFSTSPHPAAAPQSSPTQAGLPLPSQHDGRRCPQRLGRRIALTGDMVVSRAVQGRHLLGLRHGHALADCILGRASTGGACGSTIGRPCGVSKSITASAASSSSSTAWSSPTRS